MFEKPGFRRLVMTGVGIAAVLVLGLTSTASAALPAWTPPPAPTQPDASTLEATPAAAEIAAALHPATTLESHFVAVTPCRIVDTRLGGGVLRSGSTRNFYVAGTAGFPAQGGRSGGCGVPVGAGSVALNVTTTQTTGSGYLVGYAAGTAAPTSSFLSFVLGANTTTNPILPLALVSTPQLTIAARSNNTQVIIDVTGYYSFQIEGLINTIGGSSAIYSGTPRIVSVAHQAAGVAVVTLDRDVTNCTPLTGSYFNKGIYSNAVGYSANKVTVYTWYLDQSTHNPVLADNYVYLTINC